MDVNFKAKTKKKKFVNNLVSKVIKFTNRKKKFPDRTRKSGVSTFFYLARTFFSYVTAAIFTAKGPLKLLAQFGFI